MFTAAIYCMDCCKTCVVILECGQYAFYYGWTRSFGAKGLFFATMLRRCYTN